MSCEHAFFGRNGTTFSGRRMKYVVHCSAYAGETDEYLTPTQRAARQIRRLKVLLQQAQNDITRKDQDIFLLTKELVELRLFKASLSAPPDQPEGGAGAAGATEAAGEACGAGAEGAEGDGASALPDVRRPSSSPSPPSTVPPGLLPADPASHCPEKTSSPSLADSGHFEDIPASPEPPPPQRQESLQKEALRLHSDRLDHLDHPHLQQPQQHEEDLQERQQQQQLQILEERLQKLQTAHLQEAQDLKGKYNDRVDGLLQRLSDVNNRYCELRSDYDLAQDKIRQLEREAETLRQKLSDQDETDQTMYLKMYMKGQEAARFEHADQVLEFAHTAPSRVSVPELLQQLQVTESKLESMKESDDDEDDDRHTLEPKSALLSAKEALSLWLLGTRKAMYRRIVESRAKKGELDPEITLQFLKSAVYYFLTDRENHQGHLNAIESILGYNENEKNSIDKAYRMHIRK